MKTVYKDIKTIGLVLILLTLLLAKFTAAILLILLYYSFREKVVKLSKIYLAPTLLIIMLVLIFRPSFTNSSFDFKLTLPNISLSDTQQNKAPFLYVLGKCLKYDQLFRWNTPFVVIYPMSFQLKYNPKDDIYHGEFIVLIRNLGYREVRISDDIEWTIESSVTKNSWSNPQNAILYELKKLENKELSIEQKSLRNNYEIALREIKGIGKILHRNAEFIYRYAPQLEAGRDIKGSITLTIKLKYEFSNNKFAISEYQGKVLYNAKDNFANTKYDFQEIKENVIFKNENDKQ